MSRKYIFKNLWLGRVHGELKFHRGSFWPPHWSRNKKNADFSKTMTYKYANDILKAHITWFLRNTWNITKLIDFIDKINPILGLNNIWQLHGLILRVRASAPSSGTQSEMHVRVWINEFFFQPSRIGCDTHTKATCSFNTFKQNKSAVWPPLTFWMFMHNWKSLCKTFSIF